MRQTKETFYAHHRTGTNLGGLTVAFRCDPIANVLVYSVARCSDQDNFNKRIGRAIAEGRLDSNKNIGVITDLNLTEMSPGDVCREVIRRVAAKR